MHIELKRTLNGGPTDVFESDLFDCLHELDCNFEIFSLLNAKTRLGIGPEVRTEKGGRAREGGERRGRRREGCRDCEEECTVNTWWLEHASTVRSTVA